MGNHILIAKTVITLFLIALLGQAASAQMSCPELDDSYDTEIYDCGATAPVCLPLSLDNFNSQNPDISVSVNGLPYGGTYEGCDYTPFILYFYGPLLDVPGPYILDNWTVDGISYSTTFDNFDQLVDSMNVWDSVLTWVNDSDGGAITAINPNNIDTYGTMELRTSISGSIFPSAANFTSMALGTSMQLPVGSHELIVTNTVLNCADTMMVHIICTETETIEQEIYAGLTNTVCLDDSELLGPMSFLSVCGVPSGGFASFSFEPESNCVSYTGNAVGQETACFYICDNFGYCDTTLLSVTVAPVPEDVVVATILVGEQGTECLSSEGLQGSDFTLSNLCPELSEQSVTFGFNEGSLCVDYEGLAVGQDTACIIVCDTEGTCDTTSFYISVINPDINAPIAVIDFDTVVQSEGITIDVLANDTVDFVELVIILEEPSNGGTVFVNLDNTISYDPPEDFCGLDIFSYSVCNMDGCDTAQVRVTVLCDEVRIYTGFSPNDDGVNDMFRISGIEAFPNCTVKVFNVWGNMVYTNAPGEGYDNDNGWDGTWKGKDLPDGNYFYTIELNDDSKQMFTGSVVMFR